MFLTELGDALKSLDGGDTDLAEIVAMHLLTDAPEADCVEKALTAIIALAERRANPVEKGGTNG